MQLFGHVLPRCPRFYLMGMGITMYNEAKFGQTESFYGAKPNFGRNA